MIGLITPTPEPVLKSSIRAQKLMVSSSTSGNNTEDDRNEFLRHQSHNRTCIVDCPNWGSNLNEIIPVATGILSVFC